MEYHPDSGKGIVAGAIIIGFREVCWNLALQSPLYRLEHKMCHREKGSVCGRPGVQYLRRHIVKKSMDTNKVSKNELLLCFHSEAISRLHKELIPL